MLNFESYRIGRLHVCKARETESGVWEAMYICMYSCIQYMYVYFGTVFLFG